LLRGTFLEESAKNRELKEVLLALPSRMPINDFYTTSHFGVRKHPISGRHRFHAGLDLVPRSDDRVYSVKPGKVILARAHHDYGNTVIVRHERGIETLYAHLASIDVKEGQEVDTLTVLGMVGNTGASTGKHLHFEITVGGYPVDPLKVITTAQHVQQAQK
jgi:murein DD-endopeptidase MepM/ murein hydrolase activator NlpD